MKIESSHLRIHGKTNNAQNGFMKGYMGYRCFIVETVPVYIESKHTGSS